MDSELNKKDRHMSEHFSCAIKELQARPVPETARTAGYAALIDHHGLKLPVPYDWRQSPSEALNTPEVTS